VVGIIDPPSQAAAAIAEARRAGLRVILITGDHPRTAARIATDLGIATPASGQATATSLSGPELKSADIGIDGCRLVGWLPEQLRAIPQEALRLDVVADVLD
jgi:magnesium-transporting ATPase (P-type)